MEVLIALVGILAGWLLGQGGELLTSRRHARDAARVVVAEILDNLNRIADARKTPGRWWVIQHRPLVTSAWQANQLSLSSLVRVGGMLRFAVMYSTVEQAMVGLRLKLQAEKTFEAIGARDNIAALDADLDVLFDAVEEALYDVLASLGPIADLKGVDLLWIEQGRKRQHRLWTERGTVDSFRRRRADL